MSQKLTGQRAHAYAVRRMTAGYTRGDNKHDQLKNTWWAETERMIDRGFRQVFEGRNMPVPHVSDVLVEGC